MGVCTVYANCSLKSENCSEKSVKDFKMEQETLLYRTKISDVMAPGAIALKSVMISSTTSALSLCSIKFVMEKVLGIFKFWHAVSESLNSILLPVSSELTRSLLKDLVI